MRIQDACKPQGMRAGTEPFNKIQALNNSHSGHAPQLLLTHAQLLLQLRCAGEAGG